MWPLATVPSSAMNRPDRSFQQDEEDQEAAVNGEGAKRAGARVSMAPVPSHRELSNEFRIRSLRAASARRDLLSDPRIHLRFDPADCARAEPDRRGKAPVGHSHIDGAPRQPGAGLHSR